MGRKTISFGLDSVSIQRAIREVEQYKQQFIDKNTLFVQRLAEVGIPVIDQNMSGAGDSDPEHNTYITVNSFGSYSQAVLTVEGRDILFIEFGAGRFYNGEPGSSHHPKGAELGYTIGSYGKGLGKNDFWYYTADTGESVRSYGTEATMPVYKASVEIRQRIRQIAKEVFSS